MDTAVLLLLASLVATLFGRFVFIGSMSSGLFGDVFSDPAPAPVAPATFGGGALTRQ